MLNTIKHTYVLDTDKINSTLEGLWDRYQRILKNPNWEDLQEARAILYFIGEIYTEKIAVEAIERRLHLLKVPLSIDEFFHVVDLPSRRGKLDEYRRDELFCELEKLYLIIKKYKNKDVGGKYYLDEEKFIALYNQHNPNKDKRIGYRGEF